MEGSSYCTVSRGVGGRARGSYGEEGGGGKGRSVAGRDDG